MKGENDQMSSCSGAKRRNCPAKFRQTHSAACSPLAVQHGWQRHERSADASRQASADHAQQQSGFKRQVAGEKTSGVEANPDADRDGDRHPQRQIDLVPGVAMFAKDEPLNSLERTSALDKAAATPSLMRRLTRMRRGSNIERIARGEPGVPPSYEFRLRL